MNGMLTRLHIPCHVHVLCWTKGVNPCSNMGGDNIGEK